MRLINIVMNALVPVVYISNRFINPTDAKIFVETGVGKGIIFGVVIACSISLYPVSYTHLANNEEVTNNGGVVPSLVIFKMTEDQIAVVSRKMYEGSLFLTKWGRKPTTKARIVLRCV